MLFLTECTRLYFTDFTWSILKYFVPNESFYIAKFNYLPTGSQRKEKRLL